VSIEAEIDEQFAQKAIGTAASGHGQARRSRLTIPLDPRSIVYRCFEKGSRVANALLLNVHMSMQFNQVCQFGHQQMIAHS